MWRRLKKPILIIGGIAATITTAVGLFWIATHLVHENVKTSIIPKREELSLLWQRFEDFQHSIQQQKNAPVPGNSMVFKIKRGFELVQLFNDAFDIHKFVNTSLSEEKIKEKTRTIMKTVLDYALEYEQDVVPTLIRRLHKSLKMNRLIDEGQIKTTFRDYVNQYKKQVDPQSLLQVQIDRYENDRKAIEVFKDFWCAKDAKNVLQEARLFQQERKSNKAETNFEMACMMDLYATYLKDYYPEAHGELSRLANQLTKQDPEKPCLLAPQDLTALAKTIRLNMTLYPWEWKEDPIYFSQSLRDLMVKLLATQEITPQNYTYHRASPRAK